MEIQDGFMEMDLQYRHLGPEVLAFTEATLSAGAQPTKVRKLLQDKYGANLISKDLVNIKQPLIGEVHNEKSCYYKNCYLLHEYLQESQIMNG